MTRLLSQIIHGTVTLVERDGAREHECGGQAMSKEERMCAVEAIAGAELERDSAASGIALQYGRALAWR